MTRSLRPPDLSDTIGFIGLGVMGQPMALNVIKAGHQLVVWNRSAARTEPLRAAGARVAETIDDVFQAARTVIVMLVDEAVTDEVLGRRTTAFTERVAEHLLISMGSVTPDYARGLGNDVAASGGRFVESPVSGSRGPAESGTLVALLGGEGAAVESARPVLAPMTKEAIWCGPVGSGATTKLAVNHYLNVTVAALAEATHLADRLGLDRALLQRAIMAGPMASEVAGVKLQQLVDHDVDVRAACADAYGSTRMITAAARATETAAPLLDVARELYGETVAAGGGRRDMVSVIDAIRARTESRTGRRPERRSTCVNPY